MHVLITFLDEEQLWSVRQPLGSLSREKSGVQWESTCRSCCWRLSSRVALVTMRQAVGQMLRSGGRCLSQQRPSITCQMSQRLVPLLPDQLSLYSSSKLSSTGGIGHSKGTEMLQSVRQQEAVLSASQRRRRFFSVGDGDEEPDLSRHHEESLVIG